MALLVVYDFPPYRHGWNLVRYDTASKFLAKAFKGASPTSETVKNAPTPASASHCADHTRAA